MPTGVATQNKWLARGLDPDSKSQRVANYITTLRRALLRVSEACGVAHPALIEPGLVEILDTLAEGRSLSEVYGYQPQVGTPFGGGPAEVAETGPHEDVAAGETSSH